MAKISPKDKEKINYFRSLFPRTIGVEIALAEEGGFIAKVVDFPGCITEAETFSELIGMVNDAVATVLEVPKEYLPFMPTYLPPLKLTQALSLFPIPREIKGPVRFKIPV